MAFIGKLLVVVFAAMSIAVLAWAGGIYTQRINWNTPPAKGDAKDGTPGVFERQEAQVKQYNGAVDRAHSRWASNLNQVEVLERERYPRRAFYDNQLNLVRTGALNNKAVANPVRQQVVDARNGFLNVTDAVQRPVFEVRPMVPALSIRDYEQNIQKWVEDIAASQARSAQAVVDREKLNKEIIGTTQPTVVKGLRTLLAEQKTIEDRAKMEDVYVAGFVTNREAEFGLLKKRRDAMTERMKELEDWKKAGMK